MKFRLRSSCRLQEFSPPHSPLVRRFLSSALAWLMVLILIHRRVPHIWLKYHSDHSHLFSYFTCSKLADAKTWSYPEESKGPLSGPHWRLNPGHDCGMGRLRFAHARSRPKNIISTIGCWCRCHQEKITWREISVVYQSSREHRSVYKWK